MAAAIQRTKVQDQEEIQRLHQQLDDLRRKSIDMTGKATARVLAAEAETAQVRSELQLLQAKGEGNPFLESNVVYKKPQANESVSHGVSTPNEKTLRTKYFEPKKEAEVLLQSETEAGLNRPKEVQSIQRQGKVEAKSKKEGPTVPSNDNCWVKDDNLTQASMIPIPSEVKGECIDQDLGHEEAKSTEKEAVKEEEGNGRRQDVEHQEKGVPRGGGEEIKDVYQLPTVHVGRLPRWLLNMVCELASLLTDAHATILEVTNGHVGKDLAYEAALENNRALHLLQMEIRRRISGIMCELLDVLISITGDPAIGKQANAGSPNIIVRATMKRSLRAGTRDDRRLRWLFWMMELARMGTIALEQQFDRIQDDGQCTDGTPECFASLLFDDCVTMATKRYRTHSTLKESSKYQHKKGEAWEETCNQLLNGQICSHTTNHEKVECEWLIWKALLSISKLDVVLGSPPSSPHELGTRPRLSMYDARRPHLHKAIIKGLLRITAHHMLPQSWRTMDLIAAIEILEKAVLLINGFFQQSAEQEERLRHAHGNSPNIHRITEGCLSTYCETHGVDRSEIEEMCEKGVRGEQLKSSSQRKNHRKARRGDKKYQTTSQVATARLERSKRRVVAVYTSSGSGLMRGRQQKKRNVKKHAKFGHRREMPKTARGERMLKTVNNTRLRNRLRQIANDFEDSVNTDI